MRTSVFFHVFTVCTVIALSLCSFVSAAEAKGWATVGTTLTIKPPQAVTVGNSATVVMYLVSSKGTPVANQRVELFVDGVRERAARTDAKGNISVRIRQDEAGTYKLSAVFKGSKLPSLGSSKASAELVIKPEIIEIHTTPSLANIKFSLDGQVFSSDDSGIARIEVEEAGAYHLEILPVEVEDSNVQMEFGRWGDDAFRPSREIVVPLNKPLEVGFDVHYEVSQTFVDLDNQPVDPSRVTSITYKGSTGATFTFEDTESHWLPAGRVIRRSKGLEETKILYSVISIVIDGANVVSQAQQRFYANPDDLWTIQVLLYSARFTARDALFGFPIGSGIHMEYPDGEVQSYSFDPAEGYKIEGLARGIYRVTVTGADGYAPATPIALSRDQNVELLVFSYIDIGVLLGTGLFLSVGLLLFGRPYLAGQTVAAGRRIISGRRRIIPALRTQFSRLIALGRRIISGRRQIIPALRTRFLKLIALGSRILPGKKTTGLENTEMHAEDALPDELSDVAQDRVSDDTIEPQQKQTQRSRQKNEAESPV
ncbi:MAG: hypothetical protein EHM40_01170 [Chloroflexi bacterium]|nr:MAG: hypothetical protein EHM40_05080 [Chloroflexota bacterium]RPI96561.1 MAG: hypothetical protein EHM40_01170 [Chloroflexota bacterium]